MVPDPLSSGQVRLRAEVSSVVIGVDNTGLCDFGQQDYPQIRMTSTGFKPMAAGCVASFRPMQITKGSNNMQKQYVEVKTI